MATSNIAAESHTQNDEEMATSNIAAESHTQNNGEMATSNIAAESHTQNDEEMATSNNPSNQKSFEKKDLLRLSSTDTGVKHKQSLVFCSRFYPSAPTLFTGTQHLTLPPRVTPRTMEKWQHLTLPPRVRNIVPFYFWASIRSFLRCRYISDHPKNAISSIFCSCKITIWYQLW